MVDPELVAYLDKRFSEAAEQTAALRQETSQQFAEIREEAAQFRGETSQHFAEVREEAAQFRQETNQRFDQVHDRIERGEETARQTLVLLEGVRSDVTLIAEGFMGLTEKVDRLQSDVEQLPGQMKKLAEPYFRNLDSRVRVLEGRAKRKAKAL